MEKFVAVVFDTEEAAYAGAEALRALHRNGDINVSAAAVVAKDDNGQVAFRKSVEDGPLGTLFGLGVGALLGALAAPVAVAAGAAAAGTAAVAQVAATGMAVGGVTGGVFGAMHDVETLSVEAAVLAEVTQELKPGKACLVAAIDEGWTTPLDTRMAEAGGTIYRKPRLATVEQYYEAQARALDEELTALEDELRQTHEDNKAAIKAKVEATRDKIRENNDRISRRLEEMGDEFDRKLDEIDEQIEAASEQTRQKLVAQKEKIQADYRARKARLEDRVSVAEAVLAA